MDKGDGTHDEVCDDCDDVIDNGPHRDEDHDGECDDCGGNVPCNHDKTHWKDNGDGTHDEICDWCDAVVTDGEKHVDEYKNCVCDKCEAEYHDHITYVDNEDDATHNGTCDNCHELIVDHETHADGDGDGMCDKCGYDIVNGHYILVAEVPVVLPIMADTKGQTTCPTEAVIKNLTEGRNIQVKALNVSMTGEWLLVDGNTTFTEADKDAKNIAMSFRGTPVMSNGTAALDISDWVINEGASLPLNMAASIPAQSAAASSMSIGQVRYTLGWAPVQP